VGWDHGIPLLCDLSLIDKAVVGGGMSIVTGPRPTSKWDINHKKYGICGGVKFKTLLQFKKWIKEYAVKYYRPYTMIHSDAKKRYMVKCDEDERPWIVCARPWK
jgi:hypothetical protein